MTTWGSGQVRCVFTWKMKKFKQCVLKDVLNGCLPNYRDVVCLTKSGTVTEFTLLTRLLSLILRVGFSY